MPRLLQLDALRGIAIVLMVIFNWSFALSFIGAIKGGPTNAMSLFSNTWLYWWLFPRIIAASFITIAGISLALSHEKIKYKPLKFIFKKYFLRGGKIFLLGLGITAVTYLTYQNYTIWFGILHLIGLSIIISSFFLKYKKLSLLIGLAIITAGIYIQAELPHLLWLLPFDFQTFDYFPLLPWSGFVFVGIFIGNCIKKSKSVHNMFIDKTVAFLGRHSLLIYIVHQPLLVAILFLLGYAVI